MKGIKFIRNQRGKITKIIIDYSKCDSQYVENLIDAKLVERMKKSTPDDYVTWDSFVPELMKRKGIPWPPKWKT